MLSDCTNLIVILGMHKSGTSFLAASLFNQGYSCGHDVHQVGYRLSKGESPELVHINSEILGTLNEHSLNVLGNKEHKGEPTLIENYLDKQNKNTPLVLKDPRLVLTYEKHWKPRLPQHKVVVTFRNPYYVMRHYSTNTKRLKTALKSIRSWHHYNKNLVQIIKSTKCQYLVTEFECILNNEDERNRLRIFCAHDISFFEERSYQNPVQKWKLLLGRVIGYPHYQALRKYSASPARKDATV